MIKVTSAAKVLKCEEKKWEERTYYRITLLDNDGDVYVVSGSKPVAKGSNVDIGIRPGTGKKAFQMVAGVYYGD